VREGGKRVALGLKQMSPSPWRELGRRLAAGAVVAGTVKRVLPFGAFVAVLPGVEGLVHNSQAELHGQRDLRARLAPGDEVSVRVLALDETRERLSLSLLHSDGRGIEPDEAPARDDYRERAAAEPAPAATLGAALGRVLGSPPAA
jgi:small subunit ribosomal protein S1